MDGVLLNKTPHPLRLGKRVDVVNEMSSCWVSPIKFNKIKIS